MITERSKCCSSDICYHLQFSWILAVQNPCSLHRILDYKAGKSLKIMNKLPKNSMHRKQRSQVHLKSTKWEFKTHICSHTHTHQYMHAHEKLSRKILLNILSNLSNPNLTTLYSLRKCFKSAKSCAFSMDSGSCIDELKLFNRWDILTFKKSKAL